MGLEENNDGHLEHLLYLQVFCSDISLDTRGDLLYHELCLLITSVSCSRSGCSPVTKERSKLELRAKNFQNFKQINAQCTCTLYIKIHGNSIIPLLCIQGDPTVQCAHCTVEKCFPIETYKSAMELITPVER